MRSRVGALAAVEMLLSAACANALLVHTAINSAAQMRNMRKFMRRVFLRTEDREKALSVDKTPRWSTDEGNRSDKSCVFRSAVVAAPSDSHRNRSRLFVIPAEEDGERQAQHREEKRVHFDYLSLVS